MQNTRCSRGCKSRLNSWESRAATSIGHAGAIGGAIIGFIVAYCLIGFLAGLITLVLALGTGAAFVFIKQKKGLHSKKSDKGVFIYCLFKKSVIRSCRKFKLRCSIYLF